MFDYVREFRHWRQQGYSIVHFCISSDFSSSYQNACIAAADIGPVYVVDSRNLSTGQGLLVLHGAELAAAGQTAEEIQKACTDLAPQVEASFVIDRLDYLYKGGRCSALSAFGGNLLKLKPCIEVKDGKMTPGKKTERNMTVLDALIIGLCQCVAVVPGLLSLIHISEPTRPY